MRNLMRGLAIIGGLLATTTAAQAEQLWNIYYHPLPKKPVTVSSTKTIPCTLKGTSRLYDPYNSGLVSYSLLTMPNGTPAVTLAKNTFTSANSAANIEISGATNWPVHSVSFDVSNTGDCIPWAPGWDVLTVDSVTGAVVDHNAGCTSPGTPTVLQLSGGTTRYTFKGSDFIPPIASTAKIAAGNGTDYNGNPISAVEVVFNTGIDLGTGHTTLSNLTINGTPVCLDPGNTEQVTTTSTKMESYVPPGYTVIDTPY